MDPASGKRRRRRTLGLLLGCVLLLVLRPPSSGTEVVFLDVGQGDGIWIRSGSLTVLVDGGSTDEKEVGATVLEPFAKCRGEDKIDYAFVTHADADHISGLEYLLTGETGIRIGCLVLSAAGQASGQEEYRRLAAEAQARGIPVHWMQAGEALAAGDCRLTCLYAGNKEHLTEKNEHSLVLLLETEGRTLLLTGDMTARGEREMLEQTELSQIDLLKVAHHGSSTATTRELLETIRPAYAVISCGRKNHYGHPAPETVRKLEEAGCKIFYTMQEGAGILKIRRGKWFLKGFRS